MAVVTSRMDVGKAGRVDAAHVPIALIILDGLGAPDGATAAKIPQLNPWHYARTPNFARYFSAHPYAIVNTHGTYVGLPDDKTMGNSEIGHMNIGAGRQLTSPFSQIEQAIESGEFVTNAVLQHVIAATKQQAQQRGTTPRIHIAGLLSGGEQARRHLTQYGEKSGNVHASMDHMMLISEVCLQAGVDVCLHIITDGRDNGKYTNFKDSLGAIDILQERFGASDRLVIGSISGRAYAMDRDNNYDRIKPAYHAMRGDDSAARLPLVDNTYNAARRAVQQFDGGDEHQPPAAIGAHCMQDGEGFVFTNFRPDRAVQICMAFTAAEEDFYLPLEPGGAVPTVKGLFDRGQLPAFSACVAMAPYAYPLTGNMGDGVIFVHGQERVSTMQVLYPPAALPNVLPEIIARAGYAQLACAETEKYPHVTRFICGGVGRPFNEDEDWVLHPSQGDYNQQPAMQARSVADTVIHSLSQRAHHMIRVNFANADMVGHTINVPLALKQKLANWVTLDEAEQQTLAAQVRDIIQPAVQTLEILDAEMARVEQALIEAGAVALVTADHGNIENLDSNNHTVGAVPAFLVGNPQIIQQFSLQDGSLCDIAPTLLQLMRYCGYAIDTPAEMSGTILLVPNTDHHTIL